MASLFDDSEIIKAAINQENYIDKSPLFSSADKVIGLFFTNEVIHKKIGALMFYKMYGVIYMYIIYLSIFNYVYAISNAVLLYLTSQVFTSILFMLAPLFFIFILFKQTKSYFDNWINSIMGFALQQIFLIFTISFFNVFIYNLIKITLNYRVCWDTIWRLTSLAGSLSLFSFWTVSDAPNFINASQDINFSGEYNKSAPSLPAIISLWSITLIMKSFVNTITDLAALLTGGIQASALGDRIRGGMNQLQNRMSGKMGELYRKSGLEKLTQRADQKIFGSGLSAKNQRKNDREQAKKDRNLRDKMEKSANDAQKEFLKKNALAGDKALKGKDLENKLASVRKEAMLKKAESKGYNKGSDYVKKLMNSTNTFDDKGNFNMPKTDNIFNAIRIVGGNMLRDRNAGTKAMAEIGKAGGAIASAGGAVAKGVGNFVKDPSGSIKGAAKGISDSAKGAMKSASDGAKSMASGASKAVSSAKDSLGKGIKSFADDPKKATMGALKSAAGGVSSAAGGVASAIKSAVTSDFAKDPVGSVKSALQTNNTLENKAKQVDSSMSEKDAKSAIKEMSPEKREKFVNDVKEGNVNVKSSDKGSDSEKRESVANRLASYANKQNQKDLN